MKLDDRERKRGGGGGGGDGVLSVADLKGPKVKYDLHHWMMNGETFYGRH